MGEYDRHLSNVPQVKQIWVFVETCERNICFLQNLAGRIFVLWMISIVSKRDRKIRLLCKRIFSMKFACGK